MSQHLHPENVSTTTCPACLKDGEALLQRGQRGFADSDVWSLDVYLAKLIAGSVKVLRDNLHGCPPELCSETETWADDGVKAWAAILDEISVGFDSYTGPDGDRAEERTPEFERALELLNKWWGHLWD
jgi:hypothetical protein